MPPNDASARSAHAYGHRTSMDRILFQSPFARRFAEPAAPRLNVADKRSPNPSLDNGAKPGTLAPDGALRRQPSGPKTQAFRKLAEGSSLAANILFAGVR